MNAAAETFPSGAEDLPDASTLSAAPVPWVAPAAVDTRVLFARVVARRNFAGHPFWISARPPEAERIARRAQEHAHALGLPRRATLAAIGPLRIGVLRERMVLPGLPGTFPGRQHLKQVHWGESFADHALSGEAEHWIRVLAVPGLDGLDAAAQRVFDEDVRAGRDAYSRSARLGLLTSEPAFAGSGLQYEAGLHLPALAAAGASHPVRQALAALGIILTPLSLREPDTAEAGFFRVASRGDTHRPWSDQLARFRALVARVLEAETAADERLHARDPLRQEDRAHRALRVLQEARRMEYAELLHLVSAAREGVAAGLFPPELAPRLETLRVRAQPRHADAGPRDAGAGEDASSVRARLSRSLVAGF